MKANCKICGKETNVFPWEEPLCYSCRNKLYDEKIKSEIQRGDADSTSTESKIYCPYCGEIYEDWDDHELHYQEGEHEVICDSCEKKFKVTTSITIYYDTERMESEDTE